MRGSGIDSDVDRTDDEEQLDDNEEYSLWDVFFIKSAFFAIVALSLVGKSKAKPRYLHEPSLWSSRSYHFTSASRVWKGLDGSLCVTSKIILVSGAD